MKNAKREKITADKIKVVTDWDYGVYKRAKKNFERAQKINERRQRRVKRIEESPISSIIPQAGFAGWMIVVALGLAVILSKIW